ncbi:MAG: ATP-dependent Clp protease proteolytic subunit [candidate division KSB1 bacterium]|nr:ATP-dependent Clp protease proteolytic subunit [candidate division KSB1 bacterium]
METTALLSHRILFLSEPITAEVANRLIAQLLLLDADHHEAQVDLYINCPGGNVVDGLAIIDTMQCIQAPISTICVGQAASMAAWILAAGTKGRRFATPNAEVMIHQVVAAFAGQTDDIRIYTQRTMRLQERLAQMLAELTGQPIEQIQKDMEHEFFMTAKEAKAYGIVDVILEPFVKPTEATDASRM